MAKLNYVEGDYKEALNIYARVGLDDLPLTAVPPYRLRMIAEAYATKGEDRVLSSRPLLLAAINLVIPSQATRVSPTVCAG